MIIGFDAKRAANNKTGLGNYSRFIIEGLSQYYPNNNYLLYIPKKRSNSLLGELENHSNCQITYPDSCIWKKASSLWRVYGIKSQLKRLTPNLFHGLSNELPINIAHVEGMKTIVTIHDLIFLRYPHFYKPIDRKIYAYKFKKAATIADKVIAVSECTKKDIIDYFGIPQEKIEVIYQGCDKSFQTEIPSEKREEVRQHYTLPSNYLLYVGSIEDRKNLMLIVKAMTKSRCQLPLVVVGKFTSYTREVIQYINKHNLNERIIMLHDASFKDFPAIYQMASIFIYPSFFEGFGIPILEALYSKVPVIAAKGSCLEEAGGEGSLYVNPKDPDELAQTIDRVLNDESLRETMIEKGLEHASKFDHALLTHQLMECYKRVLIEQ